MSNVQSSIGPCILLASIVGVIVLTYSLGKWGLCDARYTVGGSLTATTRRGLQSAGPRPGICFIHITNSQVSFSAADDSAYQMGMFHVFDYAQRHGHAYLRVMDTSGSSHLHGVWAKPKHLSRALREYEIVVLMDMDLYIPDPTIPFTFLLDRWGFNQSTLVLQAMDPDLKPRNYITDKNGSEVLMANTGFVVLRSHPKVMRLLDQWYHCRDTTYGAEHCGGYNFTGSLNQPPWNLLVRPQLNASEHIIVPCEEANGYPETFGDKNHGCVGKYIWHPWFHKNKVQQVLADLIDIGQREQLLAELVHGDHLRFWLDAPPLPWAADS